MPAPSAVPTCLLLLALGLLEVPESGGESPPDPKAGFALIQEDDLQGDLEILAAPALEGRDSPSLGLTLAAEYIVSRLQAVGFKPAPGSESFLSAFSRDLPSPEIEACSLSLTNAEGNETPFIYGEHFVPVWKADGQASGELVVLGFGIDSDSDKYDDITGKLSGKVAVILSGEPRHRKKFEGPDVTDAADLYSKLRSLKSAGLSGVLVVRRPVGHEAGVNGEPIPQPERLGFRHTWATWINERTKNTRDVGLPVLEISPEVAEQLTGVDLLARAAVVDKKAKPPKPIFTERSVSMSSASVMRSTPIDNVVAVLPGSDPGLADEYIVLGAHYDHIGVDTRGRIGYGADDNASGVAALLEIAEALAKNPPRRSIMACAFAAEEDGLVGSKALCSNPPIPREKMVAMLNMDMLGRGKEKEVAVLGVNENPGFEKLLEKARKQLPTKIKNIVTGQGQELFERSDHFPFHEIGVPVLFFFEGLPISKNEDYHTWRDTLDEVDVDKIAKTARLVFSTAWMLANDDERPPKPRGK